MYSNCFSNKTLSGTDFDDLVIYHTAKALEAFVTEGGKGLKSSIYSAMCMAVDRQRYIDEEKKMKKRKKQ
jgi:hypothetical protein